MNDLIAILHAPARTVAARCERPVALLTPALIFVGALLLFVLDMWLMYGAIMNEVPKRLNPGMAHFGFTLNLAFFAINMLLFWTVGSGILCCLAILLDGEGEYRRVLELTGLAHAPSLIFGLLGLLIALTYQPQLQIKHLFDREIKTAADQAEFERELKAEVDKEAQTRSFKLLEICRYAFTLWTLVLCVLAVRAAFGLDGVKSALCVGGLVLLFVMLEVARAKALAGA